MELKRFRRRAREIFDSIPAELRHGVEYVRVETEALPHPSMPDVYTLGECATGEYDVGLDQPGAVRSGVHLYYGSFRELARLDEDFDWEAELWETLTHEVRHHRETTAGEDALEDLDWAEDENFRRRAGKRFDPLFFRAGTAVGDGAWEVDGDLFVQRELTEEELEEVHELAVTVDGEDVVVRLPDRIGDAHYLYLDGRWDEARDVALVLVRRQGAWEQLRRLFTRRRAEVLQSSVDLGPRRS
jgi:predicted Zn-dependent protease with MMP-like domain